MAPFPVSDRSFPHPLFAVEDFYLSRYQATRRRSVDIGGLALALRDNGSGRPSGTGWGGWEETLQPHVPCAEILSRIYLQAVPRMAPPSKETLSPASRSRLIHVLGIWSFDAHTLPTSDIPHAVDLIFDAIFAIKGVSSELRLPGGTSSLRPFFLALRATYNSANAYHNYRHALDVLQAMYMFLRDAGCVPPLSVLEHPRALTEPSWKRSSVPRGTLNRILSHSDVFMLLLAAIGHDAAHPGLNNAFMKNAGTSLSSIFNHESTLEKMHCTVVLQLMRNFGLGHLIQRDEGSLFSSACAASNCKPNMRSALVDTVLATDMSIHFRWMSEFTPIADAFASSSNAYDGLDEGGKARVKIFACQALMKSSDVSNPARPTTISETWSRALLNEWHAQAHLESSLHIPSSVPSSLQPPNLISLFTSSSPSPSLDSAPPSSSTSQPEWLADDLIAAHAQINTQISFIDVFAAPLFTALARFAPELAHFNSSCKANRAMWVAVREDLASVVPLSPQGDTQTRSRSSFDDAGSVNSPGMSDFSFTERERDARSSISSIPSSTHMAGDLSEHYEEQAVSATPKGSRVVGANQASGNGAPSSRIVHSRRVSTTSSTASSSASSSYYTAPNCSPMFDGHLDEDEESPLTTTATVNGSEASLPATSWPGGEHGEWRFPRTISSSNGTPARAAVRKSVAFAEHVRSSNSSSVGKIEDTGSSEYRIPLGIKSLRAAYQASSRKHNHITFFGGADSQLSPLGVERGGGFGNGVSDAAFPYRRRSVGWIWPQPQPLFTSAR